MIRLARLLPGRHSFRAARSARRRAPSSSRWERARALDFQVPSRSPPPPRAYRKRRARAHRRRPRRARSGIMPSMLTNLGCAGSAAVITVTGIHPIDTVKTRLQVSGTKGARNYAALGISGTVSTILKEEGPRQRPPTGVLARKREEIQPCRPRPHRVLEGDRGRLDARGVVHLISAGAVKASEAALQSRQAGRRVRRP